MITLKLNWPSCFPQLAPHLPPLLHSKKHIEFPNLGSGENRATKVFKHVWKSRLDSLACYSLIEQKKHRSFPAPIRNHNGCDRVELVGKKLSSGPLPPVLENVCCAVCPEPTDCPWVSQDEQGMLQCSRIWVL